MGCCEPRELGTGIRIHRGTGSRGGGGTSGYTRVLRGTGYTRLTQGQYTLPTGSMGRTCSSACASFSSARTASVSWPHTCRPCEPAPEYWLEPSDPSVPGGGCPTHAAHASLQPCSDKSYGPARSLRVKPRCKAAPRGRRVATANRSQKKVATGCATVQHAAPRRNAAHRAGWGRLRGRAAPR